jgi:DNA processing protein
LGIDAIAHSACLDAQGKTIGVLGCGVDVTYPRQNELLRKRILESNGILLSEFTPGTKPLPGYFVARNRIVAGLARGVLVVEGSAHSGTLTTASFAAHLGKDVFAIPGQITNTLAKAPHILLKQGAKIVTEVSDILNEYQLANRKILKEVNHSFNECEQKILSALSVEALHADDLAQKLHEDITTIISSLTTLELEDLVKKRDDGSYTTTCR